MPPPDLAATLCAAVAGAVLIPADDGYAAEVAGFDIGLVHTAPVVVAAADAADVAATVAAAAAAGVPVRAMGSGHADVPPVTDGVLVSTRRLDGVEVDAAARTAVVGAGATWHHVLDAATPAGLAPLCGSAPAVGVGGYLLGGGLGPLARTFGWSCDHVRAVELVGADATLRTVTADSDPELFFALRGGKGGFGIVTSATVELIELPSFYGGGEFYDADRLPALVRAYARFAAGDVPDALSTSLAVLRLPDLPVLPPPLRGRTVAHLRIAYVGPGADAERLLAPLRAAAGAPLLGAATDLPYAEIGTIHGDPTDPSAHETAGILLHAFGPDAAEAMLAVAGPAVQTPLAIVEVRHLGGALARPGEPRDAVGGRDAAFGLWVSGAPMPVPDAAALAASATAVRGVLDALAPWSAGHVQINFCGSVNTAEEAARAWPPAIADELGGIRRRRDPAGLFPFTPGAQ